MDNTYTNIKNLPIPQLQDLPDEIILQIFSFLPKQDLSKVAQVSKRTSVIAKDPYLWRRVSFWRKKVTTSFLQQVINRKCKFLSLHNAEVEGTLNLNEHSTLETLDISGCKANEGVLEELLGSCHSLEKFAMMNLAVSSGMITNICEQNGTTLVALNMGQCREVPLNSIELIINNCARLKSLNLYNVRISETAVNDLMNFLNPNIESLCFGFRHVVKDSHVEILLKRCKKIKHLGIISCGISNMSVTHIVNHLKETLSRLDLSAQHISSGKLDDLKSMQRLKFLKCLYIRYNGRRSAEVNRLRILLPNVRQWHLS